MPSRKEIDTDPGVLLSLEVTRLLSNMFRRSSMCQCSVVHLAAEVSATPKALRRLLRFLTAIGFLSKERRFGAMPNTYRLHLAPLVRR